MEKRKAYIITALIILLLITGLAFWYLYTAKQDLKIGQITDLELYGAGDSAGRPVSNNEPSFNTKKTTNTPQQEGLNEIIPPTDTVPLDTPESWKLVQIYAEPTVGASIADDKIRYIDQKTGYVYEDNRESPAIKVSSTRITRVSNAYSMPESKILFVREGASLAQISLESEHEDTEIEEAYLTGEVLNMTKSGSYIYYVSKNESGGTDIRSTKENSTTLWSSPLSGWGLQVTDDNVIVTQHASYNIPGYAYAFPKQGTAGKNKPTPIIQDLPGLITNVSPDAQRLLYSTSGTTGTTLYLKKVSEKDIIPLSIKTLASKCAWGSDNTTFYCAVPSSIPNNLPDDWYKGQVHFTDSLWRVNAQTGDAYELAHQTDLDIIELVEDTENGLIVFKNKTDQSLWAVIKN